MSIWSGSSRTGNNPQIREKPKNGILSAGIYPYSGDIGGSFAFLRDFYQKTRAGVYKPKKLRYNKRAENVWDPQKGRESTWT